MHVLKRLPLALISLGALLGACSDEDPNALNGGNDPSVSDGNGSDGGGGVDKVPGGELADEQFPADLLTPYTGAPIDTYDNTVLVYDQLRARVARVFADPGIGGDTDKFFADKISLLGGADFVEKFSENRVATPDYLLGLDGVAREACGRAATNRTGPFVGSTPATVNAAGESALATQLYDKILFRAATADEITAALGLVHSLQPLSPSSTSAWAGLCEALVRHQDSIFALPPSVKTATGAAKERLQMIRIAMDFAGRPPTDQEFTELAGKTASEKLDYYFGTTDFRDFYFHRTRLQTESTGTAETDEPARLWTYLVMSGAPLQELLTAEYSVDPDFAKTTRGPEHGKTGILTMPGFIKTKPGLPHYNYAARVAGDYLGQVFEVTPSIVASRLPAASTVEVGSLCISCHGILTPLEHQRLSWTDDGVYRTTDENGQAIDDSDSDLVANYPYKGKGMQGFSLKAVKKERFFRQSFQSEFAFFMGRQMRYDLDERTTYLALWNKAFATSGNIRELLKVIVNTPTYLEP